MPTEVLASVNVRQMDLDHGNLDTADGVAQGQRIVSERAGVEDDPGEAFLLGPLQPVDQLPLVVRLATVDPYASPPPVLMD